MRKNWLVMLIIMLPLVATAQDDSLKTHNLDGVTVSTRRLGRVRMAGAVNGMVINREELFRAACCNLGESFTNNPSVDVSYNDAATGAKQIRLLGLSGTYVQMLTENLPNYRGAAALYALDMVPGPWMQSIQVSKGAASVRNGFESISGQIDVEYLKPDADEGLTVNLYGNTMSRLEANADANVLLGEALSTEILAHYQNDWGHHDDNDDGFLDQPNVRQWNLQNRWKWQGNRYLFHGGLALVRERREGGQNHHTAPEAHHPYHIGIETDRYEGYLKHALVLNPERGTNIALMGNVAMHLTDALYGRKHYGVNQKNAYAQLMFESNLTPQHHLAAGLSLIYDYLGQHVVNTDMAACNERETTTGAYLQYTFSLANRLTAMAGIRADHSSLHGSFATPRLHLKYMPAEWVTLRLSAGKGYRTTHPLAEYHNLLASGRQLVVDPLEQESAWNYGVSGALAIPLAGKTLRINAEYYHTQFQRQTIVDYDSNPAVIHITNLQGKSYSNTLQVDASYTSSMGLDLTAAWRWNDVRTTYGGILREKPLTSRYKGLLTASYKTPLALWQFDITLQLNGGGRLPTPYAMADDSPSWPTRFHAYEQLSAQVTRWFRHFSVYVGGENLTGFRQRLTIVGADDPWGSLFDATTVWGPVHGALFYAGVRMNFGKRL